VKNILLVLFFLSGGVCGAQNLVPNGSFEDTVRCPYGSSHIQDALGWFGSCGSVDYFHPCANTNGTVNGVPTNFAGTRNAYNGSSYAGLITYYEPDTLFVPNYREAIGIHLTQPLTVGTRYYASTYISRGDTIFNNDTLKCASNNFGFRFSLFPTFSCPADNFSHIHSDLVVTDNINWTRITGSFIADSSYQYVIIGNFYDNANTIISLCNSYNQQWAYYYVDMVCVSPDSLSCNTPVGMQQPKQNTDVKFFPNPFSTQLAFSLSNNEPATITLYNIFSQQILQQTFTNSTTISTAHLAAGIYFYELRNTKGIVKNGKVIKE
jgi:hypothetical protein